MEMFDDEKTEKRRGQKGPVDGQYNRANQKQKEGGGAFLKEETVVAEGDEE